MSQWAGESPSSAAPTPRATPEESARSEDKDGNSGLGQEPQKKRVPAWAWGIPLFLSAMLFVSGAFALFAPLPIVVAALAGGRKWGFLAALTNCALVYWLSGPSGASLYFVAVAVLALALQEGIQRGQPLSRAGGYGLGAMLLAGAAVILFYARTKGVSPMAEFRGLVSQTADQLIASLSPESLRGLTGDLEPNEWKVELLASLPSLIGIFGLVLVWANLLMTYVLNPGGWRNKAGLPAGTLRRWKSPEWLVWPTLLAGFLTVYDLGSASVTGHNAFRILMTIYAFQGLSVLAFYFEAWKIRGLLRSAAYALAVMVMLPLVLSLGFFDQWFDFRARIRQS